MKEEYFINSQTGGKYRGDVVHIRNLILILTFTFAGSAFAQPSAQRILPEQGYTPGVLCRVEILVKNSLSTMTLVEEAPVGWEISHLEIRNSSRNKAIQENRIVLDIPTSFKSFTISYYVTPPITPTGGCSFFGTIGDVEIGGMKVIAPATPEPVGVFQNHVNLGMVEFGNAEYNMQTDEYRIQSGQSPGSGGNGHFVYREVYGDCSIEAQANVLFPKTQYYETARLGLFNTLGIDSLWFGCEIKPSEDYWYGWGKGAYVDEARHAAWAPIFDGRMKLERRGQSMRALYFDLEFQEWLCMAEHDMPFEDPIYIGLLGTTEKTESGLYTFRDVKLSYEQPARIIGWDAY